MTARVCAVHALDPETLLDGGLLSTAALTEIFDLDEDVMARLARVLRPAGREVVVLGASSEDGAGGVPALDGFVILSVREGEPSVGVVEMIGVDPRRRRAGTGAALLRAAEAELAARGATSVCVMGNAPFYAWPGVDVRYTAALCFFERAGYVRVRDAIDMTVDLASLELELELGAGAGAGAGAGTETQTETGTAAEPVPAPGSVGTGRVEVVDLARAPGLRAQVFRWVEDEFAPGWARELTEALSRADRGEVAGAFVALRRGSGHGVGAGADPEVLAFAAYGAQRPALFGPMGTAAGARGGGTGLRVMLACLAAQRASGVARADIGWVGPVSFYSRSVGARISRTYALLSRDLG